MIYVECKPDSILVQSLALFSQRDIFHEFKGKPRVVAQVSKHEKCKGMVDEDPLSIQPPYLRTMTVLHNSPETGLRLLHDGARNNHVIVLCPRLEEWVERAAYDSGVDVRRHGLPSDPLRLHSVINLDLRKFERLVEDLRTTNRFKALRDLLALS